MNNSKKILPIGQLLYKQARNASSETYPVTSRYSRFVAKKEQFTDDGVTPVHLKGGFGDKVLLASTWGLAVLGTGLAFSTFVQLVFPRKN